jgi:hypothetical protein
MVNEMFKVPEEAETRTLKSSKTIKGKRKWWSRKVKGAVDTFKNEIETGIGKTISTMETDLAAADEKLYKDAEESEASEGEYISRTIFNNDKSNKLVRWTSEDPRQLKPIFSEAEEAELKKNKAQNIFSLAAKQENKLIT